MSYLKHFYLYVCEKIYSVGKFQFENKRILRIRERALIADNSILYSNSDIQNFSNNKSKIRIGSNCHIYGSLTILPFGGNISFGDNCSLGDNSMIVSSTNIRIGNRVMIAHNVNILDNNSHPKDAKLRHEDFMSAYSNGMKEFDLESKEVKIEDDVWIGFNSIILKGVTIGRGAVIGAGSLVTKDVEPWTINVGNPLICIKKLEPINF